MKNDAKLFRLFERWKLGFVIGFVAIQTYVFIQKSGVVLAFSNILSSHVPTK
jgi:hypothetical protein